MRSYALFLALAVLHARAATIPAPEIEKKLPANGALDDVSLDNNESEHELVEPANTVKDVENNLRNSIPEVVPVAIVEEQPVVKKIALKEDSNDYVPDNDDSTNIKRVEIDLKNPGPPQRQEHDSQKPVPYLSYVDRERAVAAIKKSIAESQNIFTHGIQDVTQKFQYFFAHNDELPEVSKNIQNLKNNFDVEMVKLSKTINSYLKPEGVEIKEGSENVEVPSGIKEVENRLKTLETNFNYGVGMLSEGVELLSILKEEDEQELKISGKADTGDAPVQAGTSTGTSTGTATGTAPTNPAAGSSPANPISNPITNPVFQYLQNLNNTMVNAWNNLGNAVQNFFNPNPNQNQNAASSTSSPIGFNPINIFQGISLPNFFPQTQTQKPQEQQQQQGSAPASAQSDPVPATERPNILQQIQSTFQNIVNPGQAGQQQPQPNPITQFFTGVNEGISNFFQPRPPAQQTTQPASQPAAPASQPAAASADTPAVQGTNSVPAVPAKEADPVKQSEVEQSPVVQDLPVQSQPVPERPIQQMVKKGITDAVQKIQGLSNPSKPRDTDGEIVDPKGHWHGDNNGDSVSGVEEIKSAPEIKKPEITPEVQDGGELAAELNKTE